MAQKFTSEHIHERTDAKVRPLVLFLIVMTATVVFAFGFTVVLFEFFEQRAASYDEPVSPLQVQDELPPEPQLQVVPGLDLRQSQQAEEARLNGYGWVNQDERTVHIPIEQAIDVVLERGLPVRQNPQGSGEMTGQTSQ